MTWTTPGTSGHREAVTAVLAVLVLAGGSSACGDDGGAPVAQPPAPTVPTPAAPDAPTSTPTASRGPRSADQSPAPPPDSPAPGAADPGEFVRVVQARLPEVAADRSTAEVLGIAERACADLAADRSADEVVADVRSLGTLDAEAVDAATARELVELAIDTTCLDQAGRVDEF